MLHLITQREKVTLSVSPLTNMFFLRATIFQLFTTPTPFYTKCKVGTIFLRFSFVIFYLQHMRFYQTLRKGESTTCTGRTEVPIMLEDPLSTIMISLAEVTATSRLRACLKTAPFLTMTLYLLIFLATIDHVRIMQEASFGSRRCQTSLQSLMVYSFHVNLSFNLDSEHFGGGGHHGVHDMHADFFDDDSFFGDSMFHTDFGNMGGGGGGGGINALSPVSLLIYFRSFLQDCNKESR